MSGLERLYAHPILPIYSQSEANSDIDLGELDVEYGHKGATYREKVKLRLRFAPKDRLEIIVPLADKPIPFSFEVILGAERNKTLKLIERNDDLQVFAMGVSEDSGGIVFQPTESGFTASASTNDIATATFHLFNFPTVLGPDDYVLVTGGTPPAENFQRLGRIRMEADGWEITIAETLQTDPLEKDLDANGGFALTHVGSIARKDKSVFSNVELEELLVGLQYFLSFALGRWAGVALPVGYDRAGNKVFEQLGIGITADGDWNSSLSWFDAHHTELLSQVFPGFWSLWNSSLWRTPLRHALYWYLGACDRRVGIGVDTGVILAQSSLELLAWTYLVLDRKVATSKDFKPGGLSAAEKLRRLANSWNLPLAIPTSFTSLQSISSKSPSDGMDAITTVRNSLIHPDSGKVIPEGAYFDAWRLSLWYIDLILLHLCGHTGKYANRLSLNRFVGNVEQLP